MQSRKSIDFVQFIQDYEGEIFEKKRRATGQSYCSTYRRQIAALDMKLSEFTSRDDARAKDITSLPGLFALSISQFSARIKTDVNRYEVAFYALFEEGDVRRSTEE